MRYHSTFETHSSSAFFQERCVATERTGNFETVVPRLTLFRVGSNKSDDRY